MEQVPGVLKSFSLEVRCQATINKQQEHFFKYCSKYRLVII